MPTEPTVEFYYDYSCPFAYLASTQVRGLAERAGARLVYRPFLLGGVFEALGDASPSASPPAPARQRMSALDMYRWAEHWGVDLEMPPGHPNRTVTALRATIASDDVPRATHALFRAYWAEGGDVSDPEVVRGALDGAGLDGAELLRRAEEQTVKDDLRARTDEAIGRGVFGAPTFFVDGEPFWGQDRMDFVAEALGRPDAAPHGGAMPPSGGGRTLELFFDFSSPFAYLGSEHVEALAERAGAVLRWRPFLLGGLFQAIGTPVVPMQAFAPSKRRHALADMQRFSRRHGVPFAFPSRFPMKTVAPLRLVLAAGDGAAKLIHAIFRAYWAEDRDISDRAELAAIAAEAGYDPELLDRIDDPEIKARLRAATDEAAARGLCGAPSYVVGDLVFWGQDRTELVAKALAGWRPKHG